MSTNNTVLSELASQLCHVLEDSGTSFGIVHGAESYPLTVGRDFDIIIKDSNMPAAISIVRHVASEAGWHSVQAPIFWAGAPIIFWKCGPDGPLSFEFHFIPRLVWAGVVLAEPEATDIQSDPNHGLPGAVKGGFAKRVLTQVLAGCWPRMNERIHELQIRDSEKEAAAVCAGIIFGRQLGGQLIGALTPPDLPTLQRLAPRLRLMAILRAMSPTHPVRWAPGWFYGKICRWSGCISWKLPNLIVLSTSTDGAVTFLNAAIGHLGFTKAMVLKNESPANPQERITERTKIRLHRGLFRFVAIAGKVSEKEAIARRFPAPCRKGGNLVIEIDPDESGIKAVMILGKDRAQVSEVVASSNFGPVIAALFFRGVRATAERVDHFTES
jgi:hypothetical protein